ncbi:MAG: hypothetical protein J7M20_07465 [Deltaproteobacteria bacterium]|nr:hypothetical protein [Deltaproteobacteria bacterium]
MEMDSSEPTYYQTPVQVPDDFVLRIKQSDDIEGEFYAAYVEETSRFVEKYSHPFFENHLLSYALKNLWLTHQYNQEYMSFLLNTCTREEFLSKAAEYARSFQEIIPEQLGTAVSVLLDKLNQPLTSAELSLLLNVEPASIDSSCLSLIEYNEENVELDTDA